MFYIKNNNNFYPISEDDYSSIMSTPEFYEEGCGAADALIGERRRTIVFDDNSEEVIYWKLQKTNLIRLQLISQTDPLAMRHIRQNERLTSVEMEALAKLGKALTTAQFKELEAYTQALRDLPTTLKTWPTVADTDWPKKPVFMDKPLAQGV
jgi:hypothetical protein